MTFFIVIYNLPCKSIYNPYRLLRCKVYQNTSFVNIVQWLSIVYVIKFKVPLYNIENPLMFIFISCNSYLCGSITLYAPEILKYYSSSISIIRWCVMFLPLLMPVPLPRTLSFLICLTNAYKFSKSHFKTVLPCKEIPDFPKYVFLFLKCHYT